jgi:hypothetical protein
MALDSLNELVAKLPELRAEHERLGRLIAAIQAYAGEEVDFSDIEDGGNAEIARPVSRPGQRPSIGPDEFTGMSTSEAVRAFLARMGKGNPQGPREMARALVAGGRDSDEEKAYVNVTSSLKRMNKLGTIRQVRRGQWGLAEWYGTGAKKQTSWRKPDNGNGVETKEAAD